MDSIKIKQTVKQKYGEISKQSKEHNQSSCCGSGSCSSVDYAVFSENYQKTEGYVADADLGLGCGMPVQFAKIKKGDTVFDLGSGAGNDCFIARAITGVSGKIVGVDMTDEMIEKATANSDKLGFNNVEFRYGDIERIPSRSNYADVVISNCVLNLVPDKRIAFSEIFRILKPKGHFSISDIVLVGKLPRRLKHAGEMYVGCVSGALQKSEYLSIIAESGFINCVVQTDKLITLPDDILADYLSARQIKAYKNSGAGIFSITVYAEKPDSASNPSCGCGC